jgi:hypothetical protein
MIAIKTFDRPLTFEAINEVGRTYPVVYVFSDWTGVQEAIGSALAQPEPGEIAVVAPFDSDAEVCKRFGLASPHAMIAFSVNTPYGGAERPEQYSGAVEDARRWRRKNKAAEARGWPDAPWARPSGGAA